MSFSYSLRPRGTSESSQKVVGEAKIGGEFVMVDDEGRPVTSAHLLGRYNLIYFGFTFCPDICPYELKKMANVITAIGM
jgi:protein SCO1/2